MKPITAAPRSKSVSELLRRARRKDLLIQDADGIEYMITAIAPFDVEVLTHRRNRKLMALLDARRQSTEWIPLAEVERRLGLPPYRRKRRKPTRNGARKQ